MKKKKPVKTLEYRGVQVLIRDYVPEGELWFTSGDAPLEIFDTKITSVNINTGEVKKIKFIAKFKKRRFGKVTNIMPDA